MDPSNQRISLGLKESYFPEGETLVEPDSEGDAMETADDQEADMVSGDDGEESDEDDDEDVKSLVDSQGAQSDGGKRMS